MFFEKEAKFLILDHIDNNISNGYTLKVLNQEGVSYIKAKGIRKPDSSNRSATQIGHFSNFILIVSPSHNSLLLKKATLIKDFFVAINNSSIRKDFLFILSIINEKNDSFFSSLVYLSKIIDWEEEISIKKMILYLFYIILKGKKIIFNFNSCVVCNKSQNIVLVDLKEGGFLCIDHSNSSNVTNKEIINNLFLLNKETSLFMEESSSEFIDIIIEMFKRFIINY